MNREKTQQVAAALVYAGFSVAVVVLQDPDLRREVIGWWNRLRASAADVIIVKTDTSLPELSPDHAAALGRDLKKLERTDGVG